MNDVNVFQINLSVLTCIHSDSIIKLFGKLLITLILHRIKMLSSVHVTSNHQSAQKLTEKIVQTVYKIVNAM